MKFVIERSRWARAGHPEKGESRLLNVEGNMCCLGFTSIQCGATVESINQTFTPAHAVAVYPTLAEKLHSVLVGDHGHNNDLAEGAMLINDDSNITDAERETRLASLFQEHGHEIEFID